MLNHMYLDAGISKLSGCKDALDDELCNKSLYQKKPDANANVATVTKLTISNKSV